MPNIFSFASVRLLSIWLISTERSEPLLLPRSKVPCTSSSPAPVHSPSPSRSRASGILRRKLGSDMSLAHETVKGASPDKPSTWRASLPTRMSDRVSRAEPLSVR